MGLVVPVSTMKAVVLLFKIALSAALAMAFIRWVESGFYQRANARYRTRGLAIATIVLSSPAFLVVHLLHIGVRAAWRSRCSGKS